MATLKVTNIKNESFAGDQLYLKSDGKIGIGTTNPDEAFHVNSGSTNTAALFQSTDTEVTIQLKDSTGSSFIKARDDFRFSNNGSELMRIDSNGRMIIGHSGSMSEGCLLQVARTNDNTVEFFGFSANANGARINLTKSRNGTIGTNTLVHDDDTIGELHFRAANGSGYYRVAAIEAEMDGSISASSLPGRLIFSTTASGATTQTERMRIKSDGNVEITNNLKTNNLPGRNLIINGAFTIAQRGTSSTDQSYRTVDRFTIDYGGHDEVLTQSQHALTSSDTGPWAKGFRYSYHIQNGNQTSGADAADYIRIVTRLEAQDLANSGWAYTDSNSYATLSFWVISSVAQTFYGQVFSQDGSPKNFPFSTGALSANTWTKVEIKIPGGSGVQFDNNNKQGMVIYWWPFGGTNYTGSPSLNTWAAFSSGNRIPDMTSTWWTTNDATFELTGVQLEVGSIATEYEHKPYIKDLVECQRYFRRDGGGDYTGYGIGVINNTAGGIWLMPLDPPMRSAPTVTNDGNVRIYDGSNNANVTAWNTNRSTVKNFWIEPTTGSTSFTIGRAFLAGNNADNTGYLNLAAEL